MGDRFDRTHGEFAMTRRGIPTGTGDIPRHLRTDRIIFDRAGAPAAREGSATLTLDVIPVQLMIGYVHGRTLNEWRVFVDRACPENLPQFGAPWELWEHPQRDMPGERNYGLTIVLNVVSRAVQGKPYSLSIYPTERGDTSISLRWIDLSYNPAIIL